MCPRHVRTSLPPRPQPTPVGEVLRLANELIVHVEVVHHEDPRIGEAGSAEGMPPCLVADLLQRQVVPLWRVPNGPELEACPAGGKGG